MIIMGVLSGLLLGWHGDGPARAAHCEPDGQAGRSTGEQQVSMSAVERNLIVLAEFGFS
jgi:hypothetical protein